MIRIPDHTRLLKAYKSGKPISELAREKHLTRIVKLASNENPLGTSPKALAALRETNPELNRYTDPRSAELVAAIASRIGKDPGQVICGHGTDSLLAYMVNAFTIEGDEVLTSEGTFIGIYVSVNKMGRVVKTVPLKDYGFDLEALAAAITKRTRVVYLANPNNPTGTMYTRQEFDAFVTRVPDDVLIILDEAYAAYASEHNDYPDGMTYDRDNIIVSRTLSKVYGLAGLRVGFAVGPERLIQELYKIKLPFEPNAFAQKAAIAALDDKDFMNLTLEANRRSLAAMTKGFDSLGIRYVPTAANFLLLLLPDESLALEFYEHCLNRGLIVRPVNTFGIPNGVRINSGTDDETEFALDVISKVATEMSIGNTERVTE